MVKLTWSPKSLQELEEIFECISVDSREFAQIFIRNLINSVLTIRSFPLSGRVVPEFDDPVIREKQYKSYRIIYRYPIFHHARQLKREDI